MITDSTLVSKAGLWKSKDIHLIPLENEMFNSTDTKGELETLIEYIIVS
jgi:hypothetical protein